MNVVFLGPPGSGKGTQAARLAQRLGLLHLSTGELLRDEVRRQTPFGVQVQSYMSGGELVPDDLIVSMIESRIRSGGMAHGVILDGFPRTIPQAEKLRDRFSKQGLAIHRAILLKVSDDEIVKRLSGRWFCPNCQSGYNYPTQSPKIAGVCDKCASNLARRADDEESVVRHRLTVYKTQTQPIEQFYRTEGLLTEVPAEVNPDILTETLHDLLKGAA